MLKLIKVLFEVIVPIAFIFVVFPRVIDALKEILGIGEDLVKKPKKSNKPRPTVNQLRSGNLQGHRFPPPPPPSRMIGNKRVGKVYSKDGNSFTENGKSYTKSDELGWDVPWYKEDKIKPEPKEEVKNKHFKKGVNPDFL